jgi:hypothetical protein
MQLVLDMHAQGGPIRDVDAPRVLAGSFSQRSVIALLQEVERLRTTGVLRFDSGGVRGEVALVCGELAAEQTKLEDGRDPVDVLLELEDGDYEVFQRLPPLPVSQGDAGTRRGSLTVHVPADLMNYCERAGLTGKLTLEREDRKAEILYEGGELTTIRLDGQNGDDLQEVFGWEDGRFRVDAWAEASEPKPSDGGGPQRDTSQATGEDQDRADRGQRARGEETGREFLRAVEVELSRIVGDREKGRSSRRTGTEIPAMRKAKRPETLPPPPPEPRRREPTVRVVYIGASSEQAGDAPEHGPKAAESSEQSAGTRHVRRDLTAEEELPEAHAERQGPRGDPTERDVHGSTREHVGEHAGAGAGTGRPSSRVEPPSDVAAASQAREPSSGETPADSLPDPTTDRNYPRDTIEDAPVAKLLRQRTGGADGDLPAGWTPGQSEGEAGEATPAGPRGGAAPAEAGMGSGPAALPEPAAGSGAEGAHESTGRAAGVTALWVLVLLGLGLLGVAFLAWLPPLE